MNEKVNKTSICSIVSLELIDFSKKTDSQQIEIKNKLNNLINLAVIDIPKSDRVILETDLGTAIACIGPLEDALEDALFISLTIRDEILKNNIHSSIPFYVRFGINLGSVRIDSDINGQPKIVGEGLDEAQRISSFAKPNQILVSRVYYEMAAKLSQEISQMFEYCDMHTHEREIYSVRILKEQAAAEKIQSASKDNSVPVKWQLIACKINWKYVALSFMLLAAFLVFFKPVLTPTKPTTALEQPAVAEVSAKPAIKLTANPIQEEPEKTKVVHKKSKQKTAVEAEEPTGSTAKPVEPKKEKSASKVESSWQSFKDSLKHGSDSKCTQAEISMNQCVK